METSAFSRFPILFLFLCLAPFYYIHAFSNLSMQPQHPWKRDNSKDWRWRVLSLPWKDQNVSNKLHFYLVRCDWLAFSDCYLLSWEKDSATLGKESCFEMPISRFVFSEAPAPFNADAGPLEANRRWKDSIDKPTAPKGQNYTLKGLICFLSFFFQTLISATKSGTSAMETFALSRFLSFSFTLLGPFPLHPCLFPPFNAAPAPLKAQE